MGLQVKLRWDLRTIVEQHVVHRRCAVAQLLGAVEHDDARKFGRTLLLHNGRIRVDDDVIDQRAREHCFQHVME
jgi:hypothetical protein